MCKKIHRGGNAEQYNADKKSKEAVAVAVEACAEDTKGQTCYICTQALHWKTKEGLVRGCSCRGTAGVAHVSCLAEQAKILVAEVEENNLGGKVKAKRWKQWYTCSLCEQEYHGVVRCALSWACWKTYVGRPETDWARRSAFTQLGAGLHEADQYEAALSVQEAELAMERRLGASQHNIIIAQTNLANTYQMLGRLEDALSAHRDIYSRRLKLQGEEDYDTLREALNLALILWDTGNKPEAKELLRARVPVAERSLGREHYIYIRLRWLYAVSLADAADATFGDLVQAEALLDDTYTRFRRIMGGGHPDTARIHKRLLATREDLARARASLHA